MLFPLGSLTKLFPPIPTIPHSYEGRIDGQSREVVAVVVAKEMTADLTFDITVKYVGGPVIQGTYHALTAKPEIVKVDGQDVDMDAVHFHSGFKFPKGPWVAFSFEWRVPGTVPGLLHRADVRAFIDPSVLKGLVL